VAQSAANLVCRVDRKWMGGDEVWVMWSVSRAAKLKVSGGAVNWGNWSGSVIWLWRSWESGLREWDGLHRSAAYRALVERGGGQNMVGFGLIAGFSRCCLRRI
jgi:hypothetical protein